MVALAERALEAAVAYRVRHSQRIQLQQRREARLEASVARKRQRANEANARGIRTTLRLRLRAERGMTMDEILHGE